MSQSPAKLTRIFLALSGLLHLYYGVVFVLDPREMMDRLSIEAVTPAGITEMRAFHGGLMLALGVLFAGAAGYRPWAGPGLVLMTVTYAGAVLARAGGLVVDGEATRTLLWILSIEVAGLFAGISGLVIERRRYSSVSC